MRWERSRECQESWWSKYVSSVIILTEGFSGQLKQPLQLFTPMMLRFLIIIIWECREQLLSWCPVIVCHSSSKSFSPLARQEFTCYTSCYGGGSCEVECSQSVRLVSSLPPHKLSHTTVRLRNISSINKHGSLHYHSLGGKNIWLNIIQSRVLHNVCIGWGTDSNIRGCWHHNCHWCAP